MLAAVGVADECGAGVRFGNLLLVYRGRYVRARGLVSPEYTSTSYGVVALDVSIGNRAGPQLSGAVSEQYLQCRY